MRSFFHAVPYSILGILAVLPAGARPAAACPEAIVTAAEWNCGTGGLPNRDSQVKLCFLGSVGRWCGLGCSELLLLSSTITDLIVDQHFDQSGRYPQVLMSVFRAKIKK